jgi:glycosyltransferase involved in cell wall biosynthesis
LRRVLFAEYLVWDTPFRVGSHHYAGHFVDLGWNVGWLGGEFHAYNLLNNRAELARKVPIWRRGGSRRRAGPWEYVPLKLLPYRKAGVLGNARLAWHGHRWTLPPVKRALERGGFDGGDVLWLTNIQAYPWLTKWGAWDVTVYRAADEHSAFAGSPRSLRSVEEQVVRSVDVVFAASHGVYDRLRQLRPRGVYHLPNGVDLTRFGGVHPAPDEYRAIPRPIAVYVGAISYWFDLQLVAEVARARPGVSFVLIGEARVPARPLASIPNVHLLGPRQPEQVPAYLQHADAGLIPFVRSALTNNINPLKMYEYLACGLPVVSTDLTELRLMKAPVFLAAGPSEFGGALDGAFAVRDHEKDAYRTYASGHTWEARYERLDSVLGKLLR